MSDLFEELKYCPNCGIEKIARFCSGCGFDFQVGFSNPDPTPELSNEFEAEAPADEIVPEAIEPELVAEIEPAAEPSEVEAAPEKELAADVEPEAIAEQSAPQVEPEVFVAETAASSEPESQVAITPEAEPLVAEPIVASIPVVEPTPEPVILPQSGWYKDPLSLAEYRYWNGFSWTQRVAASALAEDASPRTKKSKASSGQETAVLEQKRSALILEGLKRGPGFVQSTSCYNCGYQYSSAKENCDLCAALQEG